MAPFTLLFDRTAVLFLGLAAGAAIGYAFLEKPAPEAPPAPVAAAPPAAPKTADPIATLPPAPVVSEVCAIPFQPRLLERLADGEPVRIGVFGDSFGDGVWSALYRLLPKADRFVVTKYSQQSTGFTRYASLNLEEHDGERMMTEPVEIAVISFGANDTQGVMHKGKFAPLMSAEWQTEIGDRVDRYVAMMRGHGAIVYWVGLPRMRKESFDADIQAMNGFFAQRMKRLGVPFIDTRPYASDPAGHYAAYLPDPATGKRTLMRANDGIHMSMTGYVWIVRDLSARIRSYIDAARAYAMNNPAASVIAS